MTRKDILMFAGGGFFSLTLLLSCDDGSPSDVDAAVCDCLPSEAPLMGRIQNFERDWTVPPANMAPTFGRQTGGSECPAGGVLLSGGCAAAVGAVPDIAIIASHPEGTNGWGCSWKNFSNESVPVRGIARCLMPVQ